MIKKKKIEKIPYTYIYIMKMVIIGLKKRDTFEEVVEYIKNSKDVIKFPDRYAKQIRNSFELSQLDGVGMMEHEEHEQQVMKETEKANALRRVA